MYERVCEMFYERISEKIRRRKEEINAARKKDGDKLIRNKDIYPDDPNLVSAIMRNQRDPKKNKYLIPGETSRSKKPKKYVETIVRTLQFDSPETLLWGNKWEIDEYVEQLFHLLVYETFYLADDDDDDDTRFNNELLKNIDDTAFDEIWIDEKESNGKKADGINKKPSKKFELARRITVALHDYIPFAKADFIGTISSKNVYAEEIVSLYTGDTSQEESQEAYLDVLLRASAWFYEEVKEEFYPELKEFLYKQKSPQKLDQRFYEFSRDTLVPMLESVVPVYSNGQEIYDTLVKHFEVIIDYMLPYARNSTKYLRELPEPKIPCSIESITAYVKADLKYVDELARMQAKERNIQKNKEENKEAKSGLGTPQCATPNA